MSRFGQGGIVAAGVAVAAAGVLAAAGAAGAELQATDHAVYAHDANGSCYSTDPATSDCAGGVRADVSIATGDSVTWHIAPPATNTSHNVAGDNDPPEDPSWQGYASDFVANDAITHTFDQPGTYDFVCQAHASMVGTVTVTGDPVGTPSPTPSATPTPTPIVNPGGGQPTTPAPPASTDKVKPTVARIKLKALRHAARVTFKLSENATVTIRVRRGKKVLKSVRLQARAGTRTVKVRSSKLTKGRYTIEVRARDASGNTSTLATKSLRLLR
jgi:plastocyanin